MTSPACPLPRPGSREESALIDRLLTAKRIAVIGASDNPNRAGNYVPEYLIEHGYEIIPVNPNHETVFGRPCYGSLDQIPGKVDLVNVFRRPGACADVTRQAIAIGAGGVWLQSGITNAEARQLACDAKLDYIEDRCIMVEHRRHRR